VAEPPLKLALIENPGKGGTLNHLGVEVETRPVVLPSKTRCGSLVPQAKSGRSTRSWLIPRHSAPARNRLPPTSAAAA